MSSFHERRQRLADTQGPLMLLEVSAPSMPEVLRIVNDNVNWTSNGSEFIAAPFGFQTTGPWANADGLVLPCADSLTCACPTRACLGGTHA